MGEEGDTADMVVYDATHVYFCKLDYDGTTAIWGRVALDYAWGE